MSRKLAIGVVGIGFGSRVHVPAFRESPAKCEVVALCARRIERAEAAARELNVPRAVADWRELVADPSVDALAIAVPPIAQAEVALAAVRAGKHVFCEKPVALDSGSARELLRAAEQARVAHAVDFIFPEIDAWRRLRARIDAGELGRIRHIALAWRVETRSHAKNAESSLWKAQTAKGGGTLYSFASHSFHYLEWLFGPITRLAARLAPAGAEADARVDAWLDFAAGFEGRLSIASDAFLGCGHRIEVHGDEGTALLENRGRDYARGFELSFGDRTTQTLAKQQTEDGDPNRDGRIEVVGRIAARFLDAASNPNTALRPNLEDGLRSQELLDAARLASSTGSWQGVRFS